MRDYLLTLLVTAIVTYLLTPLVRQFACRIGAIKAPRERDVHTAPVPLIGGLAMYGGLLAGLLVASRLPLLRQGFVGTGMVTGLLLAGGLLVVIGVIDDRWGMSALTKGAGQVAAAGILVATGTQLSWLPLPGGQTFVPTTNQQSVLTILVVVATINAVNFIDGLDGLAAGIVAIAATSFFLYYYSLTKVVDISSLAAPALASAILIGMCLGFLPHNFSPARIFMGDTGSMLLGLLLAYVPISSINSLDGFDLSSQINRYPEIMPLLLPVALLVIPYLDLLLAVVRRTKAGKSPFAPDRKHLHHRLMDIGHSQRASVLIMYLWAATFSGSVVWLSIEKTVEPGNGNHHGVPIVFFVIITAAAVLVLLLLLSLPKLRWWGRRPAVLAADSGEAAVRQAAEPQLVGVAAGPVRDRPASAEVLAGPLPAVAQAPARPGFLPGRPEAPPRHHHAAGSTDADASGVANSAVASPLSGGPAANGGPFSNGDPASDAGLVGSGSPAANGASASGSPVGSGGAAGPGSPVSGGPASNGDPVGSGIPVGSGSPAGNGGAAGPGSPVAGARSIVGTVPPVPLGSAAPSEPRPRRGTGYQPDNGRPDPLTDPAWPDARRARSRSRSGRIPSWQPSSVPSAANSGWPADPGAAGAETTQFPAVGGRGHDGDSLGPAGR